MRHPTQKPEPAPNTPRATAPGNPPNATPQATPRPHTPPQPKTRAIKREKSPKPLKVVGAWPQNNFNLALRRFLEG